MKSLNIKIIGIVYIILGFVFIFPADARVVRVITPTFFRYGQEEILILEDRTEENISLLNDKITEFVLERTGSSRIISISVPIPSPGERGVTRAYKFDVLTDNGRKITIYVKKAGSSEGRQFEKASALGIAPKGQYIPLGYGKFQFDKMGADLEYFPFDYIVCEHFEGIKLVDITDNPELLLDNENYKWIFKQLGQMISIMQNNGIIYSDYIYFNTLVNLETEQMVIVDFEFDAHVPLPITQVKFLIECLNIDDSLRQEMLRIFKDAVSG